MSKAIKKETQGFKARVEAIRKAPSTSYFQTFTHISEVKIEILEAGEVKLLGDEISEAPSETID